MSIKNELDYLEETKGLIKEAIINKGQDIDDNTPFRDYVEKIDDISTEPTKPFGTKVYRSASISATQTDLINYYVQGAQAGNFGSLYSYRVRFNTIDDSIFIPSIYDLAITDTTPCLMRIERYTYTTFDKLGGDLCYFNPQYTQIYIQIATSLGAYDLFVTPFLNNYNLTEQQLLQFNGWYLNDNGVLVTTNAPVINHCAANWIIKVTVNDFLTDNLTNSAVVNYIDFDEILLNITLVEENDFNTTFNQSKNLYGGFLGDSNALADDIIANKIAYTKRGKLTGTIVENTTWSNSLNDTMVSIRNTSLNNSIPATQFYITNLNDSTPKHIYSSVGINVSNSNLATHIGLTANKIKSGETILGITGTYSDAMKSYNSETAMNNDINNISEGEVVKVVDNNVITFYLKETTMKKLIKEEDTLSVAEFTEALDLSNDILGNS